jgi:hypothetical protein
MSYARSLSYGILQLSFFWKYHRLTILRRILNASDLSFISHAQYRYLITNFVRPQDEDVQLWQVVS